MAVVGRLQRERERLQNEPRRAGESPRERALRHGKLLFASTDGFLDRATSGPLYLREPAAARAVERAILFGSAERYRLFAWCVMANHVHALLTPIWALAKLTQGIKGFTAREINRLQSQTGRIFWQDESYDHWVRDEDELLRIIRYIEENPVRAGLCKEASNWPWSSARRREDWPTGAPFSSELIENLGGGPSG